MAMSFEECLEAICKEIVPSSEELLSYNEDAEKIQNYLIEKMKNQNTTFEKAFNGLSLHEKNWTNELPDELDIYIKLKMPFEIIPYEDISNAGYIILATPTGTTHPLVYQDHISRRKLQDWIRNILISVIEDGLNLCVNRRQYLIEYPLYGRGYGVAHTISAKELHSGKREISFDLVPAYEFQACKWSLETQRIAAGVPWFAVPFGKKLSNVKERSNEFGFMACTSAWERMTLYNKKNLKNSLRLVKAIRDVKNLELLTNNMLKSIYLDEVEARSEKFWEESLDIILIGMLETLIHALYKNYLPFFLDKRFKYLRLLRKELSKTYPIHLKMILKNLRYFQKKSKVNYTDVAVFSFARSNCGRRQTHFIN